jgi:hypothetical protein
MIGPVCERAVILPRALAIGLASRRAKAGTAAIFLGLAVFYAMLLPATDTGGAIGLISLRFLTPSELMLALLMALLLALTLALGFHGVRHGAAARPAGGVLGAVLATLPALLCCSPVLPLAIAAIAAVLPAAGSLGVPIQGFIATHETWIYGAAVAFMAWGLYGSAQRVLSCGVPRQGAWNFNVHRPNECCEDQTALPTRNLQ